MKLKQACESRTPAIGQLADLFSTGLFELIMLCGTSIARCPFEVQGAPIGALPPTNGGVGGMTKLEQLDPAPTALVAPGAYKRDARSPLPLGLRRIFQALLYKRTANRAYKSAVDECLAVLFCGFPDGLLPMVKDRVAVSGLVRRGQAAGIDVGACSVQVILLARKIIGRLSKHERQELAQAFHQHDASNLTYKGFYEMFQVVQYLNVSPALVSYLTTEVAGQLRGMSQEAIFNSWVDAQIGRVMSQLRERSREEAGRTVDVWQ